MTESFAAEIFTWEYPDEYALYNMKDTPEMRKEFLNGKYYVWLDEKDALIGFFSYESSARIPAAEEDAYSEDALDIGLGLRPQLCSQGLGGEFLKLVMDYGLEKWKYPQLRLTVAAFNRRAQKVYIKAGFQYTKELTHKDNGMKFWVMTR